MTYEETLHYLYTSTPVFQHDGASAYKPGLDTSITLDNYLQNPHKSYRTIHVGGTNGKGSVSHTLAAILQQSGYKVGLYTSPHLVDFRERIRVNGKKISKEYVTEFVERHRSFFEPLHPSFFELTSTMAFDYFRNEKVDFAIIEVGMGGRLDSTNIISPVLSIITNISLDHTQFLGDTEEQIAAEKAGIIKDGIPVLIGEGADSCVAKVFREAALKHNSPIYFSQCMELIDNTTWREDGWEIDSLKFGKLHGELGGFPQCKNNCTILAALDVLTESGINIPVEAIREGFAHVTTLTGLMGRWQQLQDKPKVICDTGHNVGGWNYLNNQLDGAMKRYNNLYMIVGMVNDKDVNGVLSLMPKNAFYFFTQASVERAMPANEFARKAEAHGLSGIVCTTVAEAVQKAQQKANNDDLIFIGGSTFIVADAVPLFLSNDDLI